MRFFRFFLFNPVYDKGKKSVSIFILDQLKPKVMI